MPLFKDLTPKEQDAYKSGFLDGVEYEWEASLPGDLPNAIDRARRYLSALLRVSNKKEVA